MLLWWCSFVISEMPVQWFPHSGFFSGLRLALEFSSSVTEKESMCAWKINHSHFVFGLQVPIILQFLYVEATF